MIGAVLFAAAGIVVGLPALYFAVEVAAGLLPARRWRSGAADPTLVVIMPAHNEAKVIARAVTAARATLRDRDRLLVIADNCTDDTARLAAEAGAQVLERHDAANRGKGFALAHGIAALADSPPDCVVILDADCAPARGAIARIAGLAQAEGRAVQACYLFNPAPEAGPVTRISNFAFMIKNLIRQRGLMRLGGSCVLTGSGMAFPWALIAQANLANGEIVEDLVLGLRLLLAGSPPLFDDQARVYSDGAPDDAETIRQRRRWEHGFVGTALRFVPALLQPSARSGIRARAVMACHLMVPPFMLLLALVCGLAGSAALAAWAGWLPAQGALIPLGLLVLLAGLLFTAWLREGRSYLRLADLARVPGYLLAKVGIWTGFVTARESRWTKTQR